MVGARKTRKRNAMNDEPALAGLAEFVRIPLRAKS
jgi:hypothetical protein